MTPGRVAIIIPTHNRWPHICGAIDSVLAQTWPDTQCMVVDDASTDGTPERLSRRYGHRIRLLTKEKNGEKSAARNDGVRAAEDAEFVGMLDSDDLLFPMAATRLVAVFADPTFDGAAYGLADRGDKRAEEQLQAFARNAPEGDTLASYLAAPFVHNNGYLLRRNTMLRVGLYREDLTNREDIELLIRLTANLDFRFCGSYVTKILRVDRSARDNHAKILAQGNRMVDWLNADPFVRSRLGPNLAHIVDESWRELAVAAYKAGDGRRFRRYLSESRRSGGRPLNARWLRRWLLSWTKRKSLTA